MNTIRKGSVGDDVKKWQAIIGVTADGNFGQATEAKTKEWQSSHKLVPDGVVGPNTWSVALGKKVGSIVAPTPQASTDNWAYEVAKKAVPSLTGKEIQYALSVARGEGFYGKGWKGEGVGSKNWGAVQGTGSAGSFSNVDHHADGSSYIGKFKRYNTDEEGFADMARILYGGGKRGATGAKEIRDAINAGSLRAAVFAQHRNGYFELAPEKYLTAVKRNYDTLVINNRWPKLMSEAGSYFGRAWNAIKGLFQ